MYNEILKKILFALTLVIFNKINFASCVTCKYSSSSGNDTVNCDTCCPGLPTTPESACCSSMIWNTGIYVALSVPIFCCIASMIAGFSYCYLIVKPTSTVQSARRHLANLRARAITPSQSITQSNSFKDLPPSYAELFQISKTNNSTLTTTAALNGSLIDPTNLNGSNVFFTKQNSNIRVLSPPPPAYSLNINIV